MAVVWREPAVSASRPSAYPEGMWKRLRRRTFAPSRPAVYPDQVGLLLLTVAALGAGTYVVLRFLL
jgi:hypothetical protein